MRSSKLWINTFFAWLLFLGIDFICHAAIFANLWEESVPAFKSLNDLAILIPAGYGSFFLLTLLVTFTYSKAYPEPPSRTQLMQFTLIWAVLFSVANFLGSYSYLEVPIKHLIVINFVYFLEISSIIIVVYGLFHSEKKKRYRMWSVLLFFILIILGIVIQNVLQN
ncbi:hypothetical protein J1N09_06325 [Aureitalea sp. L0-47]|uniref:hypothetical protein n=1 Tax=Aureitalea sp. L0-47 TaxID=2816962 RepID=UPI002237B4CB|nr:hypothetical protein [Aureitalea sp. L0-47]MCW5519445.1 hypothetical protein [Aureitalea sp. L0-47]